MPDLDKTKASLVSACDSDDLREARRHLGILMPRFEEGMEMARARALLHRMALMEIELAAGVDLAITARLRTLLHEVKLLTDSKFLAESPLPAEPLLRMRNVSRNYPRSGFGLRDINFELRAGELVAVVGLNGSGKSTFLRLAASVQRQDAGTIEYPALKSEARASVLSRVSFVPHDPPPWPTTLLEHLELLLAFYGVTGAANVRATRALVEEFELSGVGNKTWLELSAGWRARCALAVALAGNPAVLILDETMATLDPGARRWFLEHLYRLSQRSEPRTGIIASSHLVQEVESIATRILYLNEGRAEELMTPEDPAEHVIEVVLDQKWRAVEVLKSALSISAAEFRIEERPEARQTRIHLPKSVTRFQVLRILTEQGCTPIRFADISKSAARLL